MLSCEHNANEYDFSCRICSRDGATAPSATRSRLRRSSITKSCARRSSSNLSYVHIVLVLSLNTMAMMAIPAKAWLLAPPPIAAGSTPRPPFAGRATPRRIISWPSRPQLLHPSTRRTDAGARVLMFRIIMKMGQGAEGSDGMGQQDRQRQQQGEGEEGGEREEKEEEPLWLGLDLSTQSLTAAVLRGDGVGGAFNEPVVLESINYEKDLPVEQRLGSKNGMKVVGAQVTSPVAMWLHALEALLQRLKGPEGKMASIGLDLSSVRGLSVSGQQHGTVYWAEGAGEKLDAMAADAGADAGAAGAALSDEGVVGSKVETIAEVFAGCFAVADSPIWADGSTEAFASELEGAMGGAARLAELTGSRAHLRQGAPQIMKIHRERPQEYANTERISLVCSFLASVMAGRYAEIETSDGSGMNLMHIREKRWVDEALEATAPGLRERLGGDEAIVDSHAIVGNVSRYLCRRFGFSRDCAVVAGSGDNCNSLAGMGVVSAGNAAAAAAPAPAACAAAEDAAGGGKSGRGGAGGDVMVSLGTSDTLLGVTTDPSPTTTGNTMYHPCDPAAWFAMLVYKNGSLTREGVRDRRAGGSWDEFSALLRDGNPGNGGKLGLFLDLFEITPQINRQGSFVVDAEDRRSSHKGELTAHEEARAVVEGRFLSMKAHARELGVGQPVRILATGGGSNNAEVLQILADVFEAPVYTAAASDSAAIGAALRAKHGVECRRKGVSYLPFSDVYGNSTLSEPAALPTPGAAKAYAGMMDRMDALEQKVMSMEMQEELEGDKEDGEEGGVGEKRDLVAVASPSLSSVPGGGGG
ncbi:unnamed protein product [Pylaiella littoralis]